MITGRAHQGESLDALIYRHKGIVPGYLETVLEANPGIADLGPILPMGTVVSLPDISTTAQTSTKTVQLWD